MTYLFSIVNMCVLKHYIQMIMKCLKHREQLINCHLNIRQLAYAGHSQNLLSTTYMIKIGAINHGFLNFVSDNLISSQQTFNLGSVLNDIFRVYLIKRKYDKYIGVAHIIHTRIVQIEQVGGGFVGGSHHSALTKGVVPSQNTHQKHLLVSASVCVAIRKLGTLCKVASFAVLGSCGLAAESEVEALPTDGIYVLV